MTYSKTSPVALGTIVTEDVTHLLVACEDLILVDLTGPAKTAQAALAGQARLELVQSHGNATSWCYASYQQEQEPRQDNIPAAMV
jgi:hypothetical protein